MATSSRGEAMTSFVRSQTCSRSPWHADRSASGSGCDPPSCRCWPCLLFLALESQALQALLWPAWQKQVARSWAPLRAVPPPTWTHICPSTAALARSRSPPAAQQSAEALWTKAQQSPKLFFFFNILSSQVSTPPLHGNVPLLDRTRLLHPVRGAQHSRQAAGLARLLARLVQRHEPDPLRPLRVGGRHLEPRRRRLVARREDS